MKNNVRKIMVVLLSIMFLAGVAGMLWSQIGYRQGEEVYSDAKELVGLTDTVAPDVETEGEETDILEAEAEKETVSEAQQVDPYAQALSEANVAAIREVNSDVIGWIQIPDTGLSYPLLQGTDNDYYLEHTWRKTKSAVGSIFVDYRNSADLSDFNTIVYGHNMKDGSMFGHLHQFKDPDFLNAHPCLYLADDEGNSYRYRIFAVYEVSVSTAEAYQMSFESDEDKQAFIDDCLMLSAIDTGVIPGIEDSIVTLSTCTGRGYTTRWVVQAVLEQ